MTDKQMLRKIIAAWEALPAGRYDYREITALIRAINAARRHLTKAKTGKRK